MATQNGFEIIEEVVNSWDSTYKKDIGYNKDYQDFLDSFSGDNEMIFISYMNTTPKDIYISDERDNLTESFILYLKTTEDLDFANSLLSYFQPGWSYNDPTWGPRTLSVDGMIALESNSNINTFAINLKTN